MKPNKDNGGDLPDDGGATTPLPKKPPLNP